MSEHKVLTDQAVQAAFDYLNEKSEAVGIARANVIRSEYKSKRVFARLLLKAEGSSVEMKKSWATDQDEYAAAMENVAIATEVWENMQDSRNRANLIIEAWRTAEASGRQIRQLR